MQFNSNIGPSLVFICFIQFVRPQKYMKKDKGQNVGTSISFIFECFNCSPFMPLLCLVCVPIRDLQSATQFSLPCGW